MNNDMNSNSGTYYDLSTGKPASRLDPPVCMVCHVVREKLERNYSTTAVIDGRLSSQEEWSSNPESECVDLSQKGREVFEKASNYLSDTLAGSKKRNR
eukprot:scaffold13361_cov90-Skeletonema_marinoi.AAC.1